MIGPIRWGALDGRTPVEVPQVSLSFGRLPEAFDGFRIALLADLHYGPFVRAAFVRRVLQLVRDQRPDVLLLCGDLLNATRPFAQRLGEMLGAICDDLPVYAVLGNHEHYTDTDEFSQALEAAGVDVLVNEHRPIRRGRESSIALAGVDDPMAGRPDFHATLGGIKPGTFTILAGHNPDLADMVPGELHVDLMLCGHTHGGQVRLFGRALVTETKNRNYVSGLTAGPNFPLYISRGLGVVGLPLRVDSEPELPVITLRRGAPAAFP